MKKIICQLSGGWDSAAVLVKLLHSLPAVELVAHFINYGQKFLEQERRAVKYLTELFNVPVIESQAELRQSMDGFVEQYIPIRNMVLASMSFNLALAIGADSIAVGSRTVETRKNDQWCFPDCSIDFFEKTAELASLGSNRQLKVLMPLIVDGNRTTKKDAAIILLRAKVKLEKLWNCFENQNEPCGKCLHCSERKKILEELEVIGSS